MNITHVISSIDINTGGPARSVTNLCIELANKDCKCSLLSIQSPHPVEVKEIAGFTLYQVKQKGFSPLNNKLKNSNPDIFQGHGIWQGSIHEMARAARKKSIPYIISPRGMLEPWALNANKWKKKIALVLYQQKDLAKAACIHATAQMEAVHIRKLEFKNPIAIIPNGIELNEYSLKRSKELQEKRMLLFLSRIHQKKGIELLIEAWQKIDKSLKKDWCIEIAGNGEKQYIQSLNNLIVEKKLQDEIKIVGPKFGKDKMKIYHRADLFVLPTYSENFGIVVAEALACGVPVITTKGTPWKDLNTHNAGWWINIGVEPLVQTLKQAIQLNDQERQHMGLRGRQLIEEHYSIESVAQKMIELYEWILNGGEPPKFIF